MAISIDDTVTLYSPVVTRDKFGVEQVAYSKREVYCRMKSLGASEFFSAEQAGHRPELELEIAAPDYEGETVVEFHGKEYFIYRTSRWSTDTVELYLEKRVGVQSDER